MPVKIIRAAFREIQKLSYDNSQIVYQIISGLSQGSHQDVKSLQGHEKLWRTRQGKLRVIWELDSGNIVVIKAGLRGDVYDRVFDRRDRTDPLEIEAIKAIEELNKPQGTALVYHPAYEISLENSNWNKEEDRWYKFIYANYYRYSPVLTDHQKQPFDELRQSGIRSTKDWLVQSAPGTGKTVCAALLACELHRDPKWNTMLIVSPAVREDLENYSEIKKIKEQNSEGFWLGTFPDWVRKVAPELGDRLATSEEELTALRELVRFEGLAPNLGKISSRDVLLYQAFVLDRENGNNNRNAIFQENRERIEILENIRPELWTRRLERLGDRLCNFGVATQLISAPPSPPYQNRPTILIVDEAQDFLLAQLKALIAVRKDWENQRPSTSLCLLGDLNQRIQPVDFDWGQLQLGRPIELKYNYRNSRHILKFANQFLEFANQGRHGRRFPEPSDPKYAVEEGEQVRLLEYPSSELALKFLDSFDSRVNSSGEGQGERYFLQQSANQVKVLWTNPDGNQRRLEILNAEKAKGREFEACVAFRIFENNGTSQLEESFQWYTLLTRPRSRLLVVATTEEIERIGRRYFECCQTIDAIDAEQAANWITEFASGVDVSLLKDNPQETQEKLLKGCDNGPPYLDTYFVLNLAKVESESLYEWEQKAIKRLQKYYNDLPKELENNTDCTNSLKEELKNVPSENISLRCLLLRAMNCSWQAVEEASGFQHSNEKEYKRLVESIAKDLEHKNLVYEAARVREKIGKPIPKHFPFSDKIANRSGSLVSLLCQAMLDRPFPDALDK